MWKPYSRSNSQSDSRNWLDAKMSAQILGAFFFEIGSVPAHQKCGCWTCHLGCCKQGCKQITFSEERGRFCGVFFFLDFPNACRAFCTRALVTHAIARNHKSLAIPNRNFEVASFSHRNRSEITLLQEFSESQWFFWVAIAVASDLRFEVAKSLRFGSLRPSSRAKKAESGWKRANPHLFHSHFRNPKDNSQGRSGAERKALETTITMLHLSCQDPHGPSPSKINNEDPLPSMPLPTPLHPSLPPTPLPLKSSSRPWSFFTPLVVVNYS